MDCPIASLDRVAPEGRQAVIEDVAFDDNRIHPVANDAHVGQR